MRETQKQTVLRLLREAGPVGVSVHRLVYDEGITRAAAIVWDLVHHEGLDIETRYGERLADGRMKLATYVLRGARTAPERPKTPEAVSEPIRFPCGCLRASGGRSWAERCADHALADATHA